MKKNQPATSPEDETGPLCSNVDPYFPEGTVPFLIWQFERNYPVRDLSVPKIQAEFLASRLQVWNLLLQGVRSVNSKVLKVSYRKSQKTLSLHFFFPRTAN